jgi:periplasmic divalent cation tolerance protein
MYIVVISTCANRKEAERIARDVVEKRLAACVNILPVRSCYRWKGKIRDDREYLMIAKTRSDLFTKLKTRILTLHSYDLPEIVSLRIEGGYKKYLDWISDEVHN